MCKKPFRRGIAEYGCGQCLPCRINRLRTWTMRLVLEATQHQASYFVTLTYNEEHLPDGSTLVPRDLQLFLKRLREQIAPERLRFYGVGEYGERNGRPHYHLALFTSVSAERVRDEVDRAWREDGESIGYIHIGSLTDQSAAYIASYVCKRMVKKDDVRLGGRHPEFARMSLRPHGIGGGVTGFIAEQARKWCMDSPPNALRFGGRLLPIGRYLRDRVAAQMGLKKDWLPRRIPLDINMLVRQLQLREPGGVEKRESQRAYAALLAEDRQRRANLRKVL